MLFSSLSKERHVASYGPRDGQSGRRAALRHTTLHVHTHCGHTYYRQPGIIMPTSCACEALGKCKDKAKKKQSNWRNKCATCKKGMHPQCSSVKHRRGANNLLCASCHAALKKKAKGAWGKGGFTATKAAPIKRPHATVGVSSTPNSPARSKVKSESASAMSESDDDVTRPGTATRTRSTTRTAAMAATAATVATTT